MNQIIKIVSILIGTIIGAGFASGKEIYTFFKVFGNLGLFGLCLSTSMIGITIYIVLNIVKKYKVKNNDIFLEEISNNKVKKLHTITKSLLNNTINIFLIVSFFIMIAGWSAFFKQKYNIPIFISSCIMAILLYITFLNNIDGIMKISSYILPILFLIIIYITIKNVPLQEIIPIHIFDNINQIFYVVLNSFIYSSYNSIMLIPILISISNKIKTKKEIRIITFITTIILLVLSVCIFQILNLSKNNMAYIELPILKILSNTKIQEFLYSLVIIIAIYTTAVSAGYGFLESIKDKRKYKIISAVICFVSIPISYIGFGKLINIMYPLFGTIGMYQIILIFKKYSIAKKDEN